MKYFGFTLFICLVALSVLVSGKGRQRPGRGKDGNKGRVPRNSVKAITSCRGQPVDLASQLDSSAIQECLDSRTQEFQEQAQANDKDGGGGGNGKGAAKRKEKKREKLAKKLRKKCTSECELRAFNLIPDVNGTESSFPSTDIPDNFIKVFPNEVQDMLKTKMEACYNNTKPLTPKEGKKGPRQKMCFTNMRLIKCLGRSVRQVCNGKGGMSAGGDVSPKSDLNDGLMSTTPSSRNGKNEDANNDDDEEDEMDDEKDEDDDNDDDNTTTFSSDVTTKGSIPTTSVDTSKPITK